MLGFLEDYVKAFCNIEYVLKAQSLSDSDGQPIIGIYNDQGKRLIFSIKFSLPDQTEDLIETMAKILPHD